MGPGQQTHAGETFIIDNDGRIVRSLGWEVTWTSVSADGQLLVGFKELDRDEDIASAQMFVGDAASTWQGPVPGVDYALDPRFSRSGLLVAYDGRDSVHVERLELGR